MAQCLGKVGMAKSTISLVLPQVTLYTKYMNDVDHSDQIRMQYLVARKGYCWWTYLFWFLVDLSISNALVNHKNVTILNFRMHLAKQLICNIKRKWQASDMHLPKHAPEGNCLNCKFKYDHRRQCSMICTECKPFTKKVKQNYIPYRTTHLCLDYFADCHK